MTPTLPIELQLRIVDLALPARMAANFAPRRDILLACAVVHRSWTAHARGRLEDHLRIYIDHYTGAGHVAQVVRRIRPSKRVDVRVAYRRRDELESEVLHELRTQLESVEELSLSRTAGLCAPCDYKVLFETNDWHARGAVPSLRVLASGAFPFLRFLAISHMTLPFEWHDAAMPSLHTLLLTDVGPRSLFDALDSLASLRVLGAKANFGNLISSSANAWPPLQHLALIGVSFDDFSDLADDETLPNSLSSITILHLPDRMDYGRWQGQLGAAEPRFEARWTRSGVDVRRRDCEKFAEISQFDLEEWALSVGCT